MNTLVIDSSSLTIDQVYRLSICENPLVQLSEKAKKNIRSARKLVDEITSSDKVVYGVNTGFGKLVDVRITHDKLAELQRNLVRSHSAGVGDCFKENFIRAIMLIRANTLAKGFSGVRVELVEFILKMLKNGIYPLIPQKGSVGASGDLAPLAHLALAIIGEGDVFYKNKIMPSIDALKKAKLKPFKLGAKEGLSLINGTQVMSAIAALNLFEIDRLLKLSDIISAISCEALLGTDTAFRPIIHEARGQTGQIACAKNLMRLLHNSEIVKSHRHCTRTQDAYSIRCIPQVHGAVKDVVASAKKIIGTEINAATDNPLVFTKSKEFLSGGNFHGEPIALWSDFLSIALTDLSNMSERRIERLVNPSLSTLPAFLVRKSGLNSGYMIAQVTAAALVNENKILSTPASVDSIPTSANQEDHVSMGMNAVNKMTQIVANVKNILAIELLAACQAIDFREPLKPAKGTYEAYKTVRQNITFMKTDRPVYKDIEKVVALVNENKIIDNVEKVIGKLQ